MTDPTADSHATRTTATPGDAGRLRRAEVFCSVVVIAAAFAAPSLAAGTKGRDGAPEWSPAS